MEAPERDRGAWRRWGPAMGYLLLGLAMLAADLLYWDVCSFAFLYPLIGGGAVHLLLGALVPKAGESEYDSAFQGLYNAGILLLTANQAAAGFFERTGRESSYISLMSIVGWTLTAAGAAVLAMVAWDVHEAGRNRERGHRDRHRHRDKIQALQDRDRPEAQADGNREAGMKEDHHE